MNEKDIIFICGVVSFITLLNKECVSPKDIKDIINDYKKDKKRKLI